MRSRLVEIIRTAEKLYPKQFVLGVKSTANAVMEIVDAVHRFEAFCFTQNFIKIDSLSVRLSVCWSHVLCLKFDPSSERHKLALSLKGALPTHAKGECNSKPMHH